MGKNAPQTTVGGLRAVELHYRVIREIVSGQQAFFQSRTQLNTSGLGTLMPENFRQVAELSDQCKELFRLELMQAMEAHHKFVEREYQFQWMSVYMPLRFLLEYGADRTLMKLCEKYEISENRLCFALSDRILMKGNKALSVTIQNMRHRGFHFMITDFGGDGCPVMRLTDFPVDYVMISPEAIQNMGKNERMDNAVRSLVNFIGEMGATPIADGVRDIHQTESLTEYGCLYCAGALSGKYTAERYIRKKSEE
ncbi:MAG: EAL domain-containing protein [Oscillospiraceae bacterium]